MSDHSVEQATSVERQRLSVTHQSAGVLLLRVSTPTQSRRKVKVVKDN